MFKFFFTIFYLDISIFQLFHRLNFGSIGDIFFSTLSAVGYLGIGWVVLGIMWVVWRTGKDHRTIFFLVLSVFISVIVSNTIKIAVGRLRPVYSVPHVREVGNHTDTYSFPSGHTAVAVAAAYVLRRGKHPFPGWIWIWVVLVAYSRIYLGKHFPSDIIAGGFLGWGIGSLVVKCKKENSKREKREKRV